VIDLDWLKSVLCTLRATLVRVREASSNPEVRTAIALVDACSAIIGKPKEGEWTTTQKWNG
jgi:hypothetical protein